MNRRWQRLGVDQGTAEGGYDVLVTNTVTMLSDLEGYPNLPIGWDYEAAVSGLISDGTIVGVLGHLEYPHPFGADTTDYATRAATVAIDYFYGSWRDEYRYLTDNGYRKLSAAQCRKKLDWIETYREGLMSALCLDLEEPLQRLIEWPGTDLPFDDGTFKLTKEDNSYHVILARSLRGELLSESAKLAAGIKEGKRRRPKLLLATLETILAEDAGGFASKLTQWLHSFRRSEFKPQQVWLVFSIEGTILWHVARRRGLKLPALPEELSDLIITRETISGSGDK